jgi:hypothetical protein
MTAAAKITTKARQSPKRMQTKQQWNDDDDEGPAMFGLYKKIYACCGCRRQQLGRLSHGQQSDIWLLIDNPTI